MRRILPEKIQIGSNNIGTPTPGRSGNQGSTRSNISPQEAERYILYAQQYIDGRLRPYYSCPLRRIKSYETEILSNVSGGTNVAIAVHDSGEFIRGDLVRLQNKDVMETSEVLDTPNLTTVRLTTVTGTYLVADGSKLSILEFPDPIPLISAQMAVSLVLDRLFVAEQSPDVSSYGKTQRNIARAQIENILSGEVLLFGQEHTGRRFVRGSLLDRFDSPAEIQKGNEKE
jgi:hypothetical protein